MTTDADLITQARAGGTDALAAADRREMEAAAREAGLRAALRDCAGRAGIPDAAEACRAILRTIDAALAHPPSAASLRYRRMVDVVEAARSFVTALYGWADKGGWPGDKCRVLREALAALDQPTQEP